MEAAQQSRWTPLIYLGPAVFLLFTLMVYPSLDTIRLSFMDRNAEEFVGLENYEYALTSTRMQEAFRNNLIWLIFFTIGTVALGLLIATLADRVRYEALAKAIIFMPMAISFVGAGVIWKFVYDLNPPGSPLQPGSQIGVLNAILLSLDPDENLYDAVDKLRAEDIPIEDDDIANALIAVETDGIEAAVEEGTLSRDKADDLLDDLPDTVRDYMRSTLPDPDDGWQTLGQWPRTAVDAINARLAELPEGSGRAICNAIPFTCAFEIESSAEDAIDEAVAAEEIDPGRAREMLNGLRSTALAYVRNDQEPSGEGWQAISDNVAGWDGIIAGVSGVNVRAINSTLDTGIEPVDWIREQPLNNLALILVGVWIWTGFCMVILSAALKSIPGELLEAARVDGANEVQIFFRVIVPVLMPTITVVTTTMIINVLKVFDIVYVMTAGNFGTEVIANRMYLEMYGGNREFGHASAIAVVLMLLIVPIMIYNIYQFRQQEARR